MSASLRRPSSGNILDHRLTSGCLMMSAVCLRSSSLFLPVATARSLKFCNRFTPRRAICCWLRPCISPLFRIISRVSKKASPASFWPIISCPPNPVMRWNCRLRSIVARVPRVAATRPCLANNDANSVTCMPESLAACVSPARLVATPMPPAYISRMLPATLVISPRTMLNILRSSLATESCGMNFDSAPP